MCSKSAVIFGSERIDSAFYWQDNERKGCTRPVQSDKQDLEGKDINKLPLSKAHAFDNYFMLNLLLNEGHLPKSCNFNTCRPYPTLHNDALEW
jgi:hypothetical protein